MSKLAGIHARHGSSPLLHPCADEAAVSSSLIPMLFLELEYWRFRGAWHGGTDDRSPIHLALPAGTVWCFGVGGRIAYFLATLPYFAIFRHNVTDALQTVPKARK